jgi:O-antigen ligase
MKGNQKLKGKVENFLSNEKIVFIVTISIFLPYIFTGIIISMVAVHILLFKNKRNKVFIHKGSKILLCFFPLVILIPCIYRNWLGVIVGFGLIIAMLIGLFLRSVMTAKLFEKVLSLICILSLTSVSAALIQRFIIPIFNKDYYTIRVSAGFFYPNYYGVVISMVIIICAYKVITRQGNIWNYYAIAAINVISMYLCGSMFVWVEVFLGVAVLLVILKEHRLLALWLFCAAAGVFTIFVLNINIIPRLADAEVTSRLRFQIWGLALEKVRTSPLFGHGPMSYLYSYQSFFHGNIIPHVHNLYLDILMNFGLVGTVLLLWYFVKYYIAVIRACFVEKKTLINSLILAVSAATLVHGITDVTILWVQTLPLFLLVLAGFGAWEKPEEETIDVVM